MHFAVRAECFVFFKGTILNPFICIAKQLLTATAKATAFMVLFAIERYHQLDDIFLVLNFSHQLFLDVSIFKTVSAIFVVDFL